MDTQQLIADVLQAQKTILSAVHYTESADWLHLELTMRQLQGLFAIGLQPLSVGRLAELLGVTLPAASILVEKLVKEGLVVRREDSADRRRMIIQLSEQGEQLVSRLVRGNREWFHGLLTQLDAQDLAALARGMKALAEIASKPAGAKHRT